MGHYSIDVARRFTLGAELGSEEGFRLVSAVDNDSGRPCVLWEAETPEAAARLKEQSSVLTYLDHPGLPRWLGIFEREGRVVAAREAPFGSPLAALSREDKRLAAADAVAVLREGARILSYLHSFFPPVTHGRLNTDRIVVGAGGQVWLLDPSTCGAPGEDVRALCESVRGASTPEAAAALGALWRDGKPPLTAGALLLELRGLRLDPLPKGEQDGKQRLLRAARNALILGFTLIISFALGIKARFEWFPEWTAKRDWAASLQLYKEFNCSRSKNPPLVIAENILENPGLEGPCGWRGKPILRKHIATTGSHGGRYHLRLGRKEWIVQDVEIAGFYLLGHPSCCSVTLNGWMKGDSAAGTEMVALVGNGASETHLGGAGFRGSPGWTPISGTWEIPAGTRKLRLYLDGNRNDAGWFSKTHFDDFSLMLAATSAAR